MQGLELAKRYYEEVGRPMLERDFPELLPRLAAGLVGEGSEGNAIAITTLNDLKAEETARTNADAALQAALDKAELMQSVRGWSSSDRYWLAVLSVLAAFALYSGVGAMTTMGMGQAREVED